MSSSLEDTTEKAAAVMLRFFHLTELLHRILRRAQEECCRREMVWQVFMPMEILLQLVVTMGPITWLRAKFYLPAHHIQGASKNGRICPE